MQPLQCYVTTNYSALQLNSYLLIVLIDFEIRNSIINIKIWSFITPIAHAQQGVTWLNKWNFSGHVSGGRIATNLSCFCTAISTALHTDLGHTHSSELRGRCDFFHELRSLFLGVSGDSLGVWVQDT